MHLSAFITDKKMSERPAYLEYKKKVPFYLIPFPRLKWDLEEKKKVNKWKQKIYKILYFLDKGNTKKKIF